MYFPAERTAVTVDTCTSFCLCTVTDVLQNVKFEIKTNPLIVQRRYSLLNFYASKDTADDVLCGQ